MTVLPWTSAEGQAWPPVMNHAVVRTVSARRVLGIPAVGRAYALVCGMIGSMPLNAVAGSRILPRPSLLDLPDPTPGRDRSWWVAGQVGDWWLHGNCVHLVTSRDSAGLPASVMWLPVERVSVISTSGLQEVSEYRYDGVVLPAGEVIHVRRSIDPLHPWRGIGVLEQHMSAFSKIVEQEEYESAVLRGSAVPSVVVTTPGETTKEQDEEAKRRWETKFAGPQRRPVFVPPGTTVTPLSWSPKDQQLTEARQLSLTDVANIANIDAFWLGGQSGGLTYKSPGPMYLNLMRQTLQPILTALEGAWGREWLPTGQELRFDRQAVLGDDMETTIRWLAAGMEAGILTADEAREYLGKSPLRGARNECLDCARP